MLNPRQTLLIKLSWSHLSNRLEDFGETFYEVLFELYPEVKPLFKTDPEVQRQKFSSMMNHIVATIQYPERLEQELHEMGSRHVSYGVADDQYDKVMIAFLLAMEKRLKKKWDDETKEAWTMAFVYIGSQMKTRNTHT
jgi:hemoglobin-like flavoprotein